MTTEDRSVACPGEEQLAAYVDGRVTPEERAAIQRHLADCDDCREAVADAVRLRRDAGDSKVRPFWRQRRVQAIGGGVLVLAASLILVARVQPRLNPFRQPSSYEELVAAVGTSRPVEGRLTGGFRYGPYESPARAGSAAAATDYQLLAAVARVQREAEANETAGTLHALGVARLVVGDVEAAVASLEDAASLEPTAERLSDLSAAYLARARRLDRPDDYPKALAAAQRAVAADGQLAAARFNQALALESLSQRDRAIEAWRRYIELADDEGWRGEARRRLAALESAQSAAPREPDWGAVTRGLPLDALQQMVRDDPQLAREALEDRLLADWARAGDLEEAAERGRRALLVVETLEAETPDRFYAALRVCCERPLRSGAAASADLAAAHVAYAEGRQLQAVDRPVDAAVFYRRALAGFDRAGSPYAVWCRVHLARALNFSGEKRLALEELARVEAIARARGYLALRARALMLLGEASFGATRFEQAHRFHSDALAVYRQLRERDSIATMQQALAETLNMLGEPRLAWSHFLPALRFMPDMREPRRKHSVLVSASIFAIQQGYPEFAEPLLTTAYEIDTAAGLPLGAAEALLNRARVRARAGRRAEAQADLHEAATWHAQIRDRVLATRVAANLAAADAEVGSDQEPATAIARLTESIDGYTANANLFRLVRLHLARARLHRRTGDIASAEADLLRGIELLEGQQDAILELSLRVSHFDDVWDIYGEMIDLQLHRGDAMDALRFAEAARGRGLYGGMAAQRIDIDALVHRVPKGTTALVLTVLPDRVVRWRIREGSVSYGSASIGRERLEQLVQRFVESAPDAQRGASFFTAGAQLFERIVGQALEGTTPGELVVVIPDGALAAVPFGALFDARYRKFVFETAPVAVAPSLTSLVNYAASPRDAANRALVLASASSDGDGRSALPAVRDEAAAVARMYPGSVLLADASLTKQRVIEELRSVELMHFAGHAVTNDAFPALSRLVLPGGLDDHLYASEVSALDLRSLRLVVLGACSTGAGQVRRGAGALSLARSFLSAGATAVVAFAWDVPDDQAAALLTAFHQQYAGTADPVLALNRALETMRAAAPFVASRAWTGASVTIGSPLQRRPLRDRTTD